MSNILTGPDPLTGLYPNSNGGSEYIYNQLKSRIPENLWNKVQLISSRPNILLDKPKIILQHDHHTDPPENYEDINFRKKFDKHVFVSHIQQLLFVQRNELAYDESVVIRNAIVPIQNHKKPSDGAINLIYHTTPHRGLELLVPSFIEIVKKNPNLKLHLDVYSSFNAYGWSNRDVPYEPLFELCKNNPNITYHGYQPNDVVRKALEKAHIFAYPNIWPETSCIAAIEAMSAGCLVVCPMHEGLIETVGDMGITYSYTEDYQNHINKFANILNQVVNKFNDGVFLPLTLKAKNHINAYYSWDVRIPDWINLYESVINGQKARNEINKIDGTAPFR